MKFLSEHCRSWPSGLRFFASLSVLCLPCSFLSLQIRNGAGTSTTTFNSDQQIRESDSPEVVLGVFKQMLEDTVTQFKDAKVEWARLAGSYDKMAETQKLIKKDGLQQASDTLDFKRVEEGRFENDQKARVSTIFSLLGAIDQLKHGWYERDAGPELKKDISEMEEDYPVQAVSLAIADDDDDDGAGGEDSLLQEKEFFPLEVRRNRADVWAVYERAKAGLQKENEYKDVFGKIVHII